MFSGSCCGNSSALISFTSCTSDGFLIFSFSVPTTGSFLDIDALKNVSSSLKSSLNKSVGLVDNFVGGFTGDTFSSVCEVYFSIGLLNSLVSLALFGSAILFEVLENSSSSVKSSLNKSLDLVIFAADVSSLTASHSLSSDFCSVTSMGGGESLRIGTDAFSAIT